MASKFKRVSWSNILNTQTRTLFHNYHSVFGFGVLGLTYSEQGSNIAGQQQQLHIYCDERPYLWRAWYYCCTVGFNNKLLISQRLINSRSRWNGNLQPSYRYEISREVLRLVSSRQGKTGLNIYCLEISQDLLLERISRLISRFLLNTFLKRELISWLWSI